MAHRAMKTSAPCNMLLPSRSLSKNRPGVMSSPKRTKLEIHGIVSAALKISERVKRELPSHEGLAGAAQRVASMAYEAERVSIRMSRPWSLHRLPAIFLACSLVLLAIWVYWYFFHVSTLTIALPASDARQATQRRGVQIEQVDVPGSREAAEMVGRGEVDLAFVQGGIPIPAELLRLETPSPELVLWLTRDSLASPTQAKRVLTSLPGEGSHTVAQAFFAAWKMSDQIEYDHTWRDFAADSKRPLPANIDGVFVVKDPADEKTLSALERLHAAGFRLRAPELGVRATQFDYLKPTILAAGYLGINPRLPSETVSTYHVATFLVARENLRPRLLHEAAHVFDMQPPSIDEEEYSLTVSDAGEMFQGIDGFLGILVNIGLVFLALLGLEMMTYRKQFHELNSLISLLSMLQSNKDVLCLNDPELRRENLLYLGLCSDVLSLVSTISSYYTQENSSLLFNNLAEIIPQRCDSLKINIQLKILHAMINLPEDEATAARPAAEIPSLIASNSPQLDASTPLP